MGNIERNINKCWYITTQTFKSLLYGTNLSLLTISYFCKFGWMFVRGTNFCADFMWLVTSTVWWQHQMYPRILCQWTLLKTNQKNNKKQLKTLFDLDNRQYQGHAKNYAKNLSNWLVTGVTKCVARNSCIKRCRFTRSTHFPITGKIALP